MVEDSLLVYDSDAKAWVNKDLGDLVFVGATEASSGKIGLVPAPKAGETELYLRSDGTWGVPGGSAHTILTVENNDGEEHSDLIISAVDGQDHQIGDIVIVKDPIGESLWQYTAYVYDGNEWCAMDGNYDAKNVYFSDDLITTTAMGNIKLTNGQATIPSKGKNLKQVFETIYTKESDPSVTSPSVSLTFSNAKAYEVGTKVAPNYVAIFSSGSYSYGPATGITAQSWEVKGNDGSSATVSKGSLPEITVTDNTNYSITAKATYNEGAVPVTNLGNECPSKKIAAGTASASKGAITGYRSGFWGTQMDAESELDSSAIRSLTASGKGLSNGSTFTINIPVGAKRVIIAYPATLRDLTSVKDVNGMNTEIAGVFVPSTVSVEGVNSYDAIDYKLYVYENQGATKVNTYDVTI